MLASSGLVTVADTINHRVRLRPGLADCGVGAFADGADARRRRELQRAVQPLRARLGQSRRGLNAWAELSLRSSNILYTVSVYHGLAVEYLY